MSEEFFSPWEDIILDWPSAHDKIRKVLERATPSRELAWRGVSDSGYALHSSVFRRLLSLKGRHPLEKEVTDFEVKLLKVARRRWRFDNLSALEILAHIQHFGGPTRLLDVSFNPLIALWFAVEQKYESSGNPSEDTDSRIFAFDTTDRLIDLDADWGGYHLPWFNPPVKTWSTDLPFVWRPPSYNERISAQNSAFLIGGVPQVGSGGNSKYRKAPGDGTRAGTWSMDEVRSSTSVTVSMNALARSATKGSQPTFTLRVKKEGKADIRKVLENQFGLNVGSIYPDLYGLSRYAAETFKP